ncbi:glycoside hydrolase family 76 protein [Aeoliella mucimassa]|nr:glycoside hydrolase family 76 protein [Aeoliella mucimassa]
MPCILLPLVAIVFVLPHSAAVAELPSQATVLEWGDESMAAVEAAFRVEQDYWYLEDVSTWRSTPRGKPVFMWGAGVQLSALAAATSNQPEKYRGQLDGYVKALHHYWHEHLRIGGYDVSPHAGSADRYYDDNAWIVLGLVEGYEVTQDASYLKQAKATFNFVISGEDDRLGGGIYWREKELLSKNTCTNAPAMVGAIRLYELTEETAYLETAKRLYAWTCEHLQDEDGLFWDNINMRGEVDRRKYSYNSALMIRANCGLYRITGEEKYKQEAERIAKAAKAKWYNEETGAMNDAGRFAHLLVDAFLEVYATTGEQQWLDTCRKTVGYVHEELRDERGFYPGNWGDSQRRRSGKAAMIDQASVSRVFQAVARAMAN